MRLQLVILGMLAVTVLAAADTAPDADESTLSLWRDPAFRREFLGTYGIKSDIEPPVTLVEKEQMEKVLALLSANRSPEPARRFIESAAKPADSAMLAFMLGNIYLQEDKPETAAQWFRRATEKFKSFQRAHKNLGLVYVRRAMYDKAIAPLTRAIELGRRTG